MTDEKEDARIDVSANDALTVLRNMRNTAMDSIVEHAVAVQAMRRKVEDLERKNQELTRKLEETHAKMITAREDAIKATEALARVRKASASQGGEAIETTSNWKEEC